MRADSDSIAPAVPVLGVVGEAGSGKTALIQALVKEWANQGRRVAVIDRVPARDHPSSETGDELVAAGAFAHITSAPGRFVLHTRDDRETLPEIVAANFLAGAELALVESRERLNLPSIDLYRRDRQKTTVTRKSKNLLAVVGDAPPENIGAPHFKEGEVAGLMALIEEKIMVRAAEDQTFALVVNGRKVPVLPFVRDIITNTVLGLISSLKNCDQAGDIRLIIKRR